VLRRVFESERKEVTGGLRTFITRSFTFLKIGFGYRFEIKEASMGCLCSVHKGDKIHAKSVRRT
jgi:hypothetical protein